jgi:phosphatidate cytidylyltransferase
VPLPNLAKRVLFAVVAIPVVIAAVWFGGDALALLLAVASALAAWELTRLARAAGYTPFSGAAIAMAGLLPIAVRGYVIGAFAPPLLALGFMVLLALVAAMLFRRAPDQHPLGAAAITFFAVLYTGGTLSFAYGLRYHMYTITAAAGTALLIFPLVITWATDTAAFFAGRAFGRRKLMATVSPAKTFEGAIGGLIVAMLVAWGYMLWVLVPAASLAMRPVVAVLVGAAISIAAQIGDLAESLLKREAGMKDSSQLIPGHGGVLDRLDSLFFAIPAAFFIFTLPSVLIPVVR